MSDVQLDLQQVPARAELLLAAELGQDAPGRPIYARPERGAEPAARIKVGAVLTRRPGDRGAERPGRGPRGGGGGAPSPGNAALHDAAHPRAAGDPAVATILTRAHDIHPDRRRLQRQPHLHRPRRRGRRARNPRRFLHHNALMTAAHADPSRRMSIRCAPRH